jgi:CRP-like cAMP-binding protein
MAVLDPAPRSATAVALEDSQLIEIMQDDFRELLAAQPELSAGVLQMLVRRLRETSERIQQHSA